jgi:hypothetical protein
MYIHAHYASLPVTDTEVCPRMKWNIHVFCALAAYSDKYGLFVFVPAAIGLAIGSWHSQQFGPPLDPSQSPKYKTRPRVSSWNLSTPESTWEI